MENFRQQLLCGFWLLLFKIYQMRKKSLFGRDEVFNIQTSFDLTLFQCALEFPAAFRNTLHDFFSVLLYDSTSDSPRFSALFLPIFLLYICFFTPLFLELSSGYDANFIYSTFFSKKFHRPTWGSNPRP